MVMLMSNPQAAGMIKQQQWMQPFTRGMIDMNARQKATVTQDEVSIIAKILQPVLCNLYVARASSQVRCNGGDAVCIARCPALCIACGILLIGFCIATCLEVKCFVAIWFY